MKRKKRVYTYTCSKCGKKFDSHITIYAKERKPLCKECLKKILLKEIKFR